MADNEPMREVGTTEFRAIFAKLREPVIVTALGRPIAFYTPVEFPTPRSPEQAASSVLGQGEEPARASGAPEPAVAPAEASADGGSGVGLGATPASQQAERDRVLRRISKGR